MDKLNAKLGRLPDIAKREIRKAMADMAGQIVDMAVSLAPEEDGDLKASIGWTWGKAPKGSLTLGTVGTDTERRDGLVITIYAGDSVAFYARWVEFGTQPHSTAQGANLRSFLRKKRGVAGKQHPGARAQPFFFPAYRANRKKATRRIRAAVRRAAKRVSAG